LDGLALLAIIKEQYHALPVLLCSAYLTDCEEAMQRGVDGYLIKPFSRQQFLDTVTQLFAS
jgi:DNA-binding NtrC family response regulator